MSQTEPLSFAGLDRPGRPQSRLWLLLLCLALLTLPRLAAAARLGLMPDEAYYWLWSRFPSLGYYDHPPMIAWWIGASTRILGEAPLAIRALPVLAGVATSLAVWATARELRADADYALRAALWFNAMILIGVGTILATPDAPSVLFWALSVWALARLRRTGDGRLWLAVGLLAGLGCLSKYTDFFLGPGVALWLLVATDARKWFASAWLWAGGATALAVYSPNLVWNARHDWVTFAKQFGRLSAGGPTLRYAGEFFAGQFGLINPCIAVLAGVAVVAWLRSRDRGSEGATAFLALLSAPLAFYMAAHSLHDRVQANWLAPIYPSIALIAAAAAHRDSRKTARALAASAGPFGIIVSLVVLLALAFPPPLNLPIDPANKLSAGWPQFAQALDRLRAEHGASWIATANYGVTGELAFALRNRTRIIDFAERARYVFAPAPAPAPAPNSALLVIETGKADWARLNSCFGSIERLAPIARRFGDRPVAEYELAIVGDARPDLMARGCS